MKIRILIGVFVLIGMISCNNDDDNSILQGRFKFVTAYSARVNFGGVMGVNERTFEVGEIYEGTYSGGKTIKIRIAGNSELNEDCHESWCPQQLLFVPMSYLNFID